jgi:integrase
VRLEAAEGVKRSAPFGKTLADAVNYYVTYLNRSQFQTTVTEMCRIVRTEFKRRVECGSNTSRHKLTIEESLKKFEAQFGYRQLSLLEGHEIKEWLAELPLAVKTKSKHFGNIQNAYGIIREKRIITENPLEGIKNFTRSKKEEKPPSSLSREEALRLLQAAEPKILPFIAIGLFAGLRTSERDFLDWKDVHLECAEPYIDLSAKISN